MVGHVAVVDHRAEQDLDVDLVVGAVDAGRVVDEVGVDPARPRERDPRALGQAEIAALGDDPAAQLLGVDPYRVVGAIESIGVALGGGLDVGADAAVPEQLDRRQQNRPDQLVRRELLGLDVERAAGFRRQLDRFDRARVDPAARAQLGAVVVVPARARQREQPLALGEARRRIGVRVDEDVAMVERADQPDLLGQQHAVAEHVARHVADADRRERLRLAVLAELEEVALDRFPGAARGDPHALVVVARRAARREGVAQPVAVLEADRVGDVGERGGPLVGRDHQIGVVVVEAHDARRHDDAVAHPVVGQVEHAPHQGLVAAHDLGLERRAVRAAGRPLDDEAALGADRHDHAVLDRLRLHQAEHLGAEILAPVGPADAAARDLAAAQVDAFHPRRIDEDLERRPRQRQIGHRGGIDLERQIRLVRRAVAAALVEVGPQGREDQPHVAAQDAVLVEVGDAVQTGAELGLEPRQQLGAVALGVGVEARLEQLGQPARELGIVDQRLLHIRLAERNPDLEQIFAVGAQDHHLAPVEAGVQDQVIEAVVLGLAAPDPRERVLEILADLVGIEVAGRDRLDAEVVQPEARAGRRDELVGLLLEHAQAHVLEHRQHVGQRDALPGARELEAQQLAALLERSRERHRELDLASGELIDAVDVGHRGARRHLLLIRDRDRLGIGAKQPVAFLLAAGVDQAVAQDVAPRARGLDQPRLDLAAIDVGRDAVGGADDELDAGQDRFRDLGLVLDLGAVQRLLQDVLEAPPEVGVVALARDVDQARDEPGEGVAAQEQADGLALVQVQDLLHGLEQLVVVGLEQFVPRVGLEDVGERLARVAGRRQLGALEHPRHLVAEQRDLARIAIVGGRGEQAEEAVLADHLALGVEAADPDVVEIDRPVHGRARVRLGDRERHRRARLLADLRRQRGEAARGRAGGLLPPQQAERQVLDPPQLISALIAHQVVAAVAKEGEVVVGDPAQERHRLLELGRLEHLGAAPQIGDRVLDLAEHGPPVLDPRADVGQDPLEVGADRLDPLGIALAVELEMHVGLEADVAAVAGGRFQHRGQRAVGRALDRHHRVDRDVDQEAQPVERHAERIDQERHVVGDHLDHRVGRLPAVLLDLRIVDPERRLAGRAVLGEAEVGQGRAVQIERIALEQIDRRHRAVVMPEERLGALGLTFGQLIVQPIDHPLEQIGLLVLQPGCHGIVLPRLAPARHLTTERGAHTGAILNRGESIPTPAPPADLAPARLPPVISPAPWRRPKSAR